MTTPALRATGTVQLTGRPSGGKWHRYPCLGGGPRADAEGGRPSRAGRTAACPPGGVAAGRGGGRGRLPVRRGRGGVAAGARQAAVRGSGCRLRRRAGSAWLQGRAAVRARARPRPWLRSAPSSSWSGLGGGPGPQAPPGPARGGRLPGGGGGCRPRARPRASPAPAAGATTWRRRWRAGLRLRGRSGGGSRPGGGTWLGPRAGVLGGGRRKAARTWAPAQGGAAEGLTRPGPGFSPLAYRLPPPAPGGLRGTDPAVATATGWAGRGRCRAELDPRPRRPRPCPRPRLTRLPRRAPGAIPARRPLPATWASRSLTGLQGRGLRSGPRSPTRGPRSAYAAVSPQRTASASGAGTASSSLRSGT